AIAVHVTEGGDRIGSAVEGPELRDAAGEDRESRIARLGCREIAGSVAIEVADRQGRSQRAVRHAAGEHPRRADRAVARREDVDGAGAGQVLRGSWCADGELR